MNTPEQPRRHFRLAIATGLVIGLPFFGLFSYPQAAFSQTRRVPTRALSIKSRQAQLDPSLVDVPIAPQPTYRRVNPTRPIAPRAVTFTMRNQRPRVDILPPAESPRLIEEESVGHDRRRVKLRLNNRKPTAVGRTTDFPWRAIAKVYMTFNGSTVACSGTFISEQHVLTAGHCVHNQEMNGWATEVQVVPALDGLYMPYGSASVTKMRTYEAWTQRQDARYDMALLTLDKPLGKTTGWFGYRYDHELEGAKPHISGYPTDRDGGLRPYAIESHVQQQADSRLRYSLGLEGSVPGGPVFRTNREGARYVIGIHTQRNPRYSTGTRLDAAKVQHLQSWVQEDAKGRR